MVKSVYKRLLHALYHVFTDIYIWSEEGTMIRIQKYNLKVRNRFVPLIRLFFAMEDYLTSTKISSQIAITGQSRFPSKAVYCWTAC